MNETPNENYDKALDILRHCRRFELSEVCDYIDELKPDAEVIAEIVKLAVELGGAEQVKAWSRDKADKRHAENRKHKQEAFEWFAKNASRFETKSHCVTVLKRELKREGFDAGNSTLLKWYNEWKKPSRSG